MQKAAATAWKIGARRSIALTQPCVMGILNVTPDSFSDGGLYRKPSEAIDAALQMVEEGASVIDVGGESTRPGASRIDASEQIQRVIPVIEGIRRCSDVAMTIDTTLSEVACAALDAGADAINDVAAGTEDQSMFALAAERQCGLILMHRRLPPELDTYSSEYRCDALEGDHASVSDVVFEFLRRRAEAAKGVGVAGEAIVLDPGLGFGKSVKENFELIAQCRQLLADGYPLLSAASRKSFIGTTSAVESPADRLAGSLAVSVAHWMLGARIFRVHDVPAHREALAVAAAITDAGPLCPDMASSAKEC